MGLYHKFGISSSRSPLG